MAICCQQVIFFTSAVSILGSQLINLNHPSFHHTLTMVSNGLNFNSKAFAIEPTTGIRYTPPNRDAPPTTASGGTRSHEGPTILQHEEDLLLRRPTRRDNMSVPNTRGDERRPIAPPAAPVQAPSLLPQCSEKLPIFLVPKDHAGHTTSSRPKFYWYMADPGSVEFSLKKVETEEPLFTNQLTIPKAGIFKAVIPPNQSELSVGQDYFWSVSVNCQTNQGVKKVTVQAVIKRLAPTVKLTRDLKGATSPRDRARVYAQEGFWYDALAILFDASNLRPNQPSIRQDLFSLLDQVGLQNVTSKERENLRI